MCEGGEGTAKTTISAILRSITDPNTAPLRAMPREIRDLCIAANNSHILAFDNVSDMRPWISDALCRMSTGGGFAVRQLYTDQDEVLFDAVRPIILNGIESVVTRPDLADRSVVLSLKIVEPSARLPEKELWSKFDRDKPFILGGLLDSVARGLNDLPSTKLSSLPRMADFALWGQACEQTKGVFMKAYFGNREAVVDAVIEADVIATAVRDFIVDRGKWEGTMASLLSLLGAQVGDRVATSRGWPTSARGLSGALTRLSASLLRVGVTYTPPVTRQAQSSPITCELSARFEALERSSQSYAYKMRGIVILVSALPSVHDDAINLAQIGQLSFDRSIRSLEVLDQMTVGNFQRSPQKMDILIRNAQLFENCDRFFIALTCRDSCGPISKVNTDHAPTICERLLDLEEDAEFVVLMS